MKIEVSTNNLDDEWWFDIGISCNKTEHHGQYTMVFTIALAFVSIYIRFMKKKG